MNDCVNEDLYTKPLEKDIIYPNKKNKLTRKKSILQNC